MRGIRVAARGVCPHGPGERNHHHDVVVRLFRGEIRQPYFRWGFVEFLSIRIAVIILVSAPLSRLPTLVFMTAMLTTTALLAALLRLTFRNMTTDQKRLLRERLGFKSRNRSRARCFEVRAVVTDAGDSASATRRWSIRSV